MTCKGQVSAVVYLPVMGLSKIHFAFRSSIFFILMNSFSLLLFGFPGGPHLHYFVSSVSGCSDTYTSTVGYNSTNTNSLGVVIPPHFRLVISSTSSCLISNLSYGIIFTILRFRSFFFFTLPFLHLTLLGFFNEMQEVFLPEV